jgi:hypothetical protein
MACIVSAVIANICVVVISIQIFWTLCVLAANAAGLTLIRGRLNPEQIPTNIIGLGQEVEKS